MGQFRARQPVIRTDSTKMCRTGRFWTGEKTGGLDEGLVLGDRKEVQRVVDTSCAQSKLREDLGPPSILCLRRLPADELEAFMFARVRRRLGETCRVPESRVNRVVGVEKLVPPTRKSAGQRAPPHTHNVALLSLSLGCVSWREYNELPIRLNASTESR